MSGHPNILIHKCNNAIKLTKLAMMRGYTAIYNSRFAGVGLKRALNYKKNGTDGERGRNRTYNLGMRIVTLTAFSDGDSSRAGAQRGFFSGRTEPIVDFAERHRILAESVQSTLSSSTTSFAMATPASAATACRNGRQITPAVE